MDLQQKIRTLPTQPGVYLYKNAEGEVIYVGKAKNLRSRVRSYLLEAAQANAKTGSLMREAVDVDYILVANEARSARARKQSHQAAQAALQHPAARRQNLSLRQAHAGRSLSRRSSSRAACARMAAPTTVLTSPAISPIASSICIHRSFLHSELQGRSLALSSARLPAVLHQALPRPLRRRTHHAGDLPAKPCAMRSSFSKAASSELERSLATRMDAAAAAEQYELAARNIATCSSPSHQVQEKQRIASAEGDDADVFGYHFENDMLAVNLFHMRGGKIVDRREFFWEDLPELVADARGMTTRMDTGRKASAITQAAFASAAKSSSPPSSSSSTSISTTSRAPSSCRSTSPIAMHSAALLARAHRPPRRDRRSAARREAFARRPRRPERQAVLRPALPRAAAARRRPSRRLCRTPLMLPELPRRIECFDISHIQGAETVASMVVWEDGAMKKSDYRKFQSQDRRAASTTSPPCARVVTPPLQAVCRKKTSQCPRSFSSTAASASLHAAAAALEELGLTTQPLASIAKREEIIYVYGQEDDPIVLDRRSPVLHLVQTHPRRVAPLRRHLPPQAPRDARPRSRSCWTSPASARAPASVWCNTSGRSALWSRLRSRRLRLLWRGRWRRRSMRIFIRRNPAWCS